MPKVLEFISELRQSEAKELHIGVAGFCWGGQHIVELARGPVEQSSLVHALFTAHPSMLSIPNDIEAIRKPLSIAVGDSDHLLSEKQIRQIDQILERNAVLHEVVIYEGAGHGFSIRIDRVNLKQAEQAVQAEKQAVDWFTKCFNAN
jgi:dienelactone hydrolase